MYDGSFRDRHQLEVHWGRNPGLCYYHVHAVHILSCLWSHCVSNIVFCKSNLNSGLLTYTTLNGLVYITTFVSRGYIVPPDEDFREYWTSKSRESLSSTANKHSQPQGRFLAMVHSPHSGREALPDSCAVGCPCQQQIR